MFWQCYAPFDTYIHGWDALLRLQWTQNWVLVGYMSEQVMCCGVSVCAMFQSIGICLHSCVISVIWYRSQVAYVNPTNSAVICHSFPSMPTQHCKTSLVSLPNIFGESMECLCTACRYVRIKGPCASFSTTGVVHEHV